MRLYGNEIFDLGLSTLKESEIWSVRVQAAKMLEEAVRQLKGTLEANKAGRLIAGKIQSVDIRITMTVTLHFSFRNHDTN